MEKFDRFVDDLEKMIILEEPDSFWSCTGLFRSAVANGYFTELINEHLIGISRSDQSIFAFRNQLVLRRHFRISLLGLNASVPTSQTSEGPSKPQTIRDHAQHCIVANLGPGVVSLSLFTQPDTTDHDMFDRTKTLRAESAKNLEPGELICFRAARDLFSIREVDGNAALATLTGPMLHEILWEYDSETLLPIRSYASRLSATRAQYGLALVSEMSAYASEETVTIAKSLASHSAHFIRWAVVSTLFKLSPDAGNSALDKMQTDLHPHVRRAARASLGLNSAWH